MQPRCKLTGCSAWTAANRLPGLAVRCRGIRLAKGRAGRPISGQLVQALRRCIRHAACLAQGQLTPDDLPRSPPAWRWKGCDRAGRARLGTPAEPAFGKVILTADAMACVGAHNGADGGSSSSAPAASAGRYCAAGSIARGGWGLSRPRQSAADDEETLRRVLAAHDGRAAWTELLRAVFGATSVTRMPSCTGPACIAARLRCARARHRPCGR